MWWYRDQNRSPAARPAPRPKPRAPEPALDAGPAVSATAARVLRGRGRDPDAWLLMSLFVDSRIEFDDGSVSDGMTWLDAERAIGASLAAEGPLRLYNRFAKEFGDGYSRRDDVPASHRDALGVLRAELSGAPGVVEVRPRTPRAVTTEAPTREVVRGRS